MWTKEKAREYAKEYYQKHRLERGEKYFKALEKHRVLMRKKYRENPHAALEKMHKYNLSLKLKVLTHYGNSKCACVICGESRPACLSIDHINGGGNKHKKELGITTSTGFYRWLINNNYPKGYQTLCMNCQYVKKYQSRNENNTLSEKG